MKKNMFLWLVAVMVVMTSCQKEAEGVDNSSGAALFGNWKYAGMKMKSNTDATIVMDKETSRFVVTLDYGCDAAASGGIYNFAADKITAKDVFYTPTGTMTMKMYDNGVLQMDESMPMTSDKLVASGSSTWKAIGSDSIYCPGGAILKVSDPLNGMTKQDVSTVPAGYKYKIEGNKLTLYLNMKGNLADVPPMNGVKATYKADWVAEVWMIKQ